MENNTIRNRSDLMKPLWFMYPHYSADSAGLQTGEAGAYAAAFAEWKAGLMEAEQAEYDRLFPAPYAWDPGADRMEYGIFSTLKWHEEDVPTPGAEAFAPPFIVFENNPEREEIVTENCFSNWYLEPFRVEDKEYTCIEQYMMEAKALLFGDGEIGALILAEADPGEIKALGRKIRGFDEALWNQFKYRIVLTGCYYKFACSADLRAYLLSTGDACPVEANPNDKIWGVALAGDDPAIQDPAKWGGSNLLGQILMEVRDEIRRVWANEELVR